MHTYLRTYYKVRTCVRTYVRAYVRSSTKRFFDFNEIWHVGRGQRVTHDSMQYDPIQLRSRSRSWAL